MQFVSRLYRDYTDLEQMRRFLIRARTRRGDACGYFHVGDMIWRMFSNGWFVPKEDIRLWFDNNEGSLLGFGWYYRNEHAVDLQVYPENEAVEREILAWGEAKVGGETNGNGRKTITVGAMVSNTERIALLQALGYEQDENHYVHLFRSLVYELPSPQLPDGFSFGLMTRVDIPNRVRVHRAAFHPSQMSEKIYGELWQAPGYLPELDVLIEAPDGRFVSFCLCWIDPVNRIGELEPVGTHPDYQRIGLGTAVVQAGMQRLKAFGAESAFVIVKGGKDGPQNLYQSRGFKEIGRDYDFVKTL